MGKYRFLSMPYMQQPDYFRTNSSHLARSKFRLVTFVRLWLPARVYAPCGAISPTIRVCQPHVLLVSCDTRFIAEDDHGVGAAHFYWSDPVVYVPERQPSNGGHRVARSSSGASVVRLGSAEPLLAARRWMAGRSWRKRTGIEPNSPRSENAPLSKMLLDSGYLASPLLPFCSD